MTSQRIKHNYALVVVAATLFIATSDSLPYAYYQLLHWVVAIASGYFAYNIYRLGSRSSNLLAFLLGFTAILFNPIAPIHLRKDQWSPIDAIAGAFLLVVFVTILLLQRNRTKL